MESHEADEQFQRVFDLYPSYRDYLTESGSGNRSLDAWSGMLANCDAADVTAVVDQIMSGEIDPREKYVGKDMLPAIIRSRAIRMRDDRKQRERHEQLMEQGRRRDMPMNECKDMASRFGKASKLAMAWGALVSMGEASEQENEVAMANIHNWHQTGEGELPELDSETAARVRRHQARKGM